MIFICYSWANAQATHALHRRLTRSGRETWIDIEKLDLNSDIKGQLETAIRGSRIVLLVDSAEARASEWTRFELACADKNKIPVMRVRPSQFACRLTVEHSIPLGR